VPPSKNEPNIDSILLFNCKWKRCLEKEKQDILFFKDLANTFGPKIKFVSKRYHFHVHLKIEANCRAKSTNSMNLVESTS
jgi:hypothetical protein